MIEALAREAKAVGGFQQAAVSRLQDPLSCVVPSPETVRKRFGKNAGFPKTSPLPNRSPLRDVGGGSRVNGNVRQSIKRSASVLTPQKTERRLKRQQKQGRDAKVGRHLRRIVGNLPQPHEEAGLYSTMQALHILQATFGDEYESPELRDEVMLKVTNYLVENKLVPYRSGAKFRYKWVKRYLVREDNPSPCTPPDRWGPHDAAAVVETGFG